MRLLPYLILFLSVFTAMAPSYAAPPTDEQILYLLNRTSYGPTPGEVAEVRELGLARYIEQQLHPVTLPRSLQLENQLNNLIPGQMSLEDVVSQYAPNQDEGKLSPDEKREVNKRLNTILFDLSEAKIRRAIESPSQLQEVMTDFWFNHFNVFFNKGLDRVLISTYERDAIRPYALGKFSDLLKATAHHPAMLFYLDNWQNTDPNSVMARKIEARKGKEIGINENYAREIMELHTLGVNGGYTQADVTTLAHILTGWGIGRGQGWIGKASFEFDSQRHDYNDKIFLGQHIHGGDTEEIDQVLDMLAVHPSTAYHISYELAQYFVSDSPPESLVKKLAFSFETSGGDIAQVLKTLFYAPEFWDPQYAQTKFKPPFRYIVSIFRATGLTPPGDTKLLQGAIGGMGEPLYRCLTPNGYSNTNDQWVNSDSLLKRINVAQAVAAGLGDQIAPTIVSSRANEWSRNTLSIVHNAAPKMQPALLLSSPEFLYY